MSQEPGREIAAIETNKRTWWTDGILVGLASAYAYVAAFAYQAGGAAYFHVPHQLVSVDLIEAFVAAVVLYFSLAWVLMTVNLASPLWHKAPSVARQPLKTVVTYVMFTLVPLVILGVYELWWVPLLMFALVVSGEFLLPLLTQKDVEGYLNKLAASIESDTRQKPAKPSLLQSAVARSPRVALVAMIAITLLGAAYLAGMGQSRRQKEFMVWSGTTERVAVFASSNRLVFAEFDREQQTTGRELTIIAIPSDEGHTFSLEKVGPLRLAD